MRKLKLFDISIGDNSQAVGVAGLPLRGCVTVELDGPMDVQGIRLHLKAEANVLWTEDTTGHGNSTLYGANEKYIDADMYIFGSSDGSTQLQSGRQTFPFEFAIRHDVPSSFEGDFGNVRYVLEAKIKRRWKTDIKMKRCLTMINMLDLNRVPDILNRQEGQVEETLCCLCCRSGPIVAQLLLDRRGYVPGEFIGVRGKVTNGSNRKINASSIKFILKTFFHTTTKTRQSVREIGVLRKGTLASGETARWNGERLHIPPLPPSELSNCSIITIEYYVVVSRGSRLVSDVRPWTNYRISVLDLGVSSELWPFQMVVIPSGPAFNIEVPLEVVIGTVPLRNAAPPWFSAPPSGVGLVDPRHQPVTQQPALSAQYPSPSSEATAAIAPAPATVPSPPPYSTVPPSYSECVFGKVLIQSEDENNDDYNEEPYEWTPQYSYYNRSQPPQSANASDVEPRVANASDVEPRVANASDVEPRVH